MSVVTFKNRSSELRALLKVFKYRFDDLNYLKLYEPALRRLLFLSTTPQNEQWRGEGFHWLALMYEDSGLPAHADQHYRLSLETFKEFERLGVARTKRDYGLFLARTSDPEAGIAMIEEALELHAEDARNAKGRRQRRITESYLWRAQLLRDKSDKQALNSLIEYALGECRDCSLRDQQQLIAFAINHAPPGVTRQLLVARLVEIHARRRNAGDVLVSAAKFVVSTEVMIIRAILTRPFRKE